MRASLLLSASAVGALAQSSGSAPVVTSNPAGAAYIASLPESAFDKAAYPDGGNVVGKILAESAPGGSGVNFKVSFSNLPTTGGPFTYHIHAHPVPANGNCTATGAHLDPYNRTESPVCDSSAKNTCQVGDLAGKYGKITSDPFTVNYTDLYASTDPANPAFFGDLSFVLHYPNKTRISCANFEAVKSPSYNATSTYSAPSSTGYATGTATPNSVVTAGAPANRAAVYGAGVGIMAALLL
ncbi:superoxide dismutase [Ophiostoma piceae UAMH 11346]|uniref:superoxide dismutase n=1 Tax=Ophiostoma piceae (strain UAMH 11346) TaxID=1262450 RepID=S3BW62_OPHP1|nr:superoxide dismutase [Ophiostoma piceae UAMH 11346]